MPAFYPLVLAKPPRSTESRWELPKQKIMLVEEDPSTINDGGWDAFASDRLFIRHDTRPKYTDTDPNAGSPMPNPGYHGNAAFVDGHAEWVVRSDAQPGDFTIPPSHLRSVSCQPRPRGLVADQTVSRMTQRF
jgi:prepilin-type processing-associated H-X9-DG protein